MGPQYQPEELLRLRESPLVSKPASLPPVEEWMGPVQEQASKRLNGARGKQEGSFGNESTTRPSLLETRHISRTSGNVPSDIVLGPPKTAFASASALKSPRQFDSPARSAFGNFGGDGSRGDYFAQKGRYNVDREHNKDDRPTNNPSSKSRFDSDNWSGPRSARGFTNEDDSSTRRYGDRDRTQEPFRREGDENRRNGAGRGSKPSWLRDDEISGTSREGLSEHVRSREWREGDRNMRRPGDRDWSRNTKAEQDPEWMAEERPKEKKEKHTAEDIEQWKAAMRAQAKGAKDEIASGEGPHHFRSTSGSTVSKTKVDTPLTTLDNGADTFFNIWDRPKTNQDSVEQDSEHGSKPQNTKQAAPKSSRFTGFFSPQPPSKSKGSDAPASSQQYAATSMPTAEESALNAYNAVFDENPTEDKAGFERMLQMLRSNPKSDPEDAQSQQQPRPIVERGRTAEGRLTPELQQNDTQSPKVWSPKTQRSHGFESLLGPQSPRDPAPQYNKDAEFLLNLLRKDDTWKQAFPGMGKSLGGNAPGILPHPNLMAQYQSRRPPDENEQVNFAEDLMPDHPRPLDKLNPTTSGSRSQHQPGAPFDEADDQGHFPPPFPMGNPNIPPGLQRPPGFDHAPPPGFQSFVTSQQQGQRGGPMAPPPGFPTPSRNPNPGQFPPGLAPRMAGLNLGGPERGPPMVGMGPPGPGPGPFMGGPPQFPPHHSAGFPVMGHQGGGGPFGPSSGSGGRPVVDHMVLLAGGGGEFSVNSGGGGRSGLGLGPGVVGPGGPPPSGQFSRGQEP